MHWKWAVTLTCLYGVLKKLRPATPFLTPFLMSPDFKNFTNHQVYGEIYPYFTYSNLVALVPIFFLSDLLLYKPVMVLEALMLSFTWALLVFGTSLRQMQIMQVFFGIATSADIAYQSYLYAIVHRKHFKRITSYVHTSTMLGKFLAYSCGQFLVSTGVASYLLLNQVTLICMCSIIPIALCLPYVSRCTPEKDEVINLEEENVSFKKEPNEELVNSEKDSKKSQLLSQFSVFHTNPTVLAWSIWWALTSCGMCQVFNYAQTLWALRQQEGQVVANGLVEGINTLLAALMTFLLQFMQFDWQHHGEWIFLVSSLTVAAMLAVMVQLKKILVDFAFYLLISSFYHVLLAVASNLIASQLPSGSYSLVFGFNTFLALILQCLLTFVVTDKKGWLALDIETQFQVYSGYFVVIGALFLLMMVASQESNWIFCYMGMCDNLDYFLAKEGAENVKQKKIRN